MASAAIAKVHLDDLKTSILIVDDHCVLRDGLRSLLENNPCFKVVGAVASSQEALDYTLRYKPDFIIADIALAGTSFLQVLGSINQKSPRSRVILFTAFPNRHNVERALNNNVWGMVTKTDSTDALFTAINAAAHDTRYYSAEIMHLINSVKTYRKSQARLSPREIEVLKCMGQGKTRQSIADDLFISVRTVDRHRQNIMDKLNLHHEIELAHFAIREGYADIH